MLFPGAPLSVSAWRCRWKPPSWSRPDGLAWLALINAAGVDAQLVAAHVGERGAATSHLEAQTAHLEAKISVQAYNIADLDRRLGEIDSAIEDASKHGKTNGAFSAIESQRTARAGLVDERKREAARALATLQRERATVAAKGRQMETESAPIRHVAELIGADTDSERAIRWLIALRCCAAIRGELSPIFGDGLIGQAAAIVDQPIGKFHTKNQFWQLVVASEATPHILCGFDEFGDHGERGTVRQPALRPDRTVAHGYERAFDGVRGSQVLPSRSRARRRRSPALAAHRARAVSDRAAARAILRTFTRTVGEADELFATLRRRANQYQNALLLIFEPGLQVDAVGLDVDAAFRRQIALLPCTVLVDRASLRRTMAVGESPGACLLSNAASTSEKSPVEMPFR